MVDQFLQANLKLVQNQNGKHSVKRVDLFKHVEVVFNDIYSVNFKKVYKYLRRQGFGIESQEWYVFMTVWTLFDVLLPDKFDDSQIIEASIEWMNANFNVTSIVTNDGTRKGMLKTTREYNNIVESFLWLQKKLVAYLLDNSEMPIES